MTATLNRPINKRHYMTKTKWAAIGFAAPLVVYLVIFYIAPLVQNISMSLHRFTRRTFVTGDAPFVGFDIYHEVLSNGEFWTTLRQTLIFVVLSIIFQYAIGLALAVFFNQNFKLSGVLRVNICSFQGHCYCRRRPIALFDDYCGSRPPLLRIKATGC